MGTFEGLDHTDARVNAFGELDIDGDLFWSLFDAGLIDEGFITQSGEWHDRDDALRLTGFCCAETLNDMGYLNG